MSFFRRSAPLPALCFSLVATLPGCLLDWEEKETLTQECPASTSCDFDCTDAERCLVECGAASACKVDCANAEDCIVECGSAASCEMTCEDAGGCSLDCESGASGSCSGSCTITNIATSSCDQA